MSITLKCACCGKPFWGRTDRTLLDRLQSAKEAPSAAELFEGINVQKHGRQIVLHRIRNKLVKQGYRLANVAKHPHPARYRLEKIEAAG